MKVYRKLKTTALGIAVAVLVAAVSTGLCGCDFNKEKPFVPTVQLSELRASGAKVLNAEDEEIYLRGVNAGGVCVIEQWMNGFMSSGSRDDGDIRCVDHKTTTLELAKRFGKDKTAELWANYRENYWSDIDFENCEEMGFNVIRLPFTYMTVDYAAAFDYNAAGKKYDFSALDEFVDNAAQHGMYTILDLHGAYGSQNGQDHSGEVKEDVDFYSNEQMISLTVKLWGAVAEHFKDNANVAGYDILNEPAEHQPGTHSSTYTTEKRHWDVFDRIYKGIRAKDAKHIVIFESCWEGYNLPRPTEYGWENCMYSFHHYTNYAEQGSETAHLNSWVNKLNEISGREFGVPLYMGEFTAYNVEKQWNDTLGLLNASGWHWTSWTYKINATGRMAWGIINMPISQRDKINAHTDSYATILDKFADLYTGGETAERYTFPSGRTLFDLMKKYTSEA